MAPFQTVVNSDPPKPVTAWPFVSSSGKDSDTNPHGLPTVTLEGSKEHTLDDFAELTLGIVREIAIRFNTSEQRVLGYMVEHLHSF
jgi:hypothetical protein